MYHVRRAEYKKADKSFGYLSGDAEREERERVEVEMNVFRLIGDLSHLLAILLLLFKIWKTRSCAGTDL